MCGGAASTSPDAWPWLLPGAAAWHPSHGQGTLRCACTCTRRCILHFMLAGLTLPPKQNPVAPRDSNRHRAGSQPAATSRTVISSHSCGTGRQATFRDLSVLSKFQSQGWSSAHVCLSGKAGRKSGMCWGGSCTTIHGGGACPAWAASSNHQPALAYPVTSHATTNALDSHGKAGRKVSCCCSGSACCS